MKSTLSHPSVAVTIGAVTEPTREPTQQPSARPLHPHAVRIQQALTEAGALGRARMLDDSARTAAEAASALGVEVGQITNSLVFVINEDRPEPLLILTSGRHRVDTARVATLLGVTKISRADADFVREHTGASIGGVSPIGHPAPLRTLIDIALGDYDVVWAAAGHSHAVFPTTFEELVRITDGRPAEVGD
jgi:prolyl-tRNA editing enzyme YbaK/EbsC (Cys-tRNA(Pro) deacylase)